jgi:hypothetical protein
MAERKTIVTPPPVRSGCGINPAVILTGMVIASVFNWFFTSGKKSRQATRNPRYNLGDQVEGREVTAVRTMWEYQFNDGSEWIEETL